MLKAVEAKGVDAAAELEDERVALSAKLGENIVVVGAARFEAVDGAKVHAYTHAPANKYGSLLQMRGGDDELGRKVAMQIVSLRPRWIGRDDVPDGRLDLTERFHHIVEAQVRHMPAQYLWIHRRFKGLTPDYPNYYAGL